MEFSRVFSGFEVAQFAAAHYLRPEQPLGECRGLYWAALLGVVEGPPDSWPAQLAANRDRYAKLKAAHEPSQKDLTKVDPNLGNPLAAMTAANPWSEVMAAEELLSDIWKDVDRTHAELPLFQQEATRKALQRILFVWSREYKLPYIQGMNEICAALFYAVDALPAALAIDARAAEADVYALFEALMSKGPAEMFATESMESAARRNAGLRERQTPIGTLPTGFGPVPDADTALLARCGFVYHQMLRDVDAELYNHLASTCSIEPQLFLLRWIRLFFTREFELEESLGIWDAIFVSAFVTHGRADLTVPVGPARETAAAASGCLPLVDYFALAMLKSQRIALLQEDTSGCLAILLRFPPTPAAPLVATASAMRGGGRVATPPRQAVFEASEVPYRCATCLGTEQVEPMRSPDPLSRPDPLRSDPLRPEPLRSDPLRSEPRRAPLGSTPLSPGQNRTARSHTASQKEGRWKYAKSWVSAKADKVSSAIAPLLDDRSPGPRVCEGTAGRPPAELKKELQGAIKQLEQCRDGPFSWEVFDAALRDLTQVERQL